MTSVAVRPAVHRPHRPWYRILYVQVLIAIALGILIGYFYPDPGKELKPLTARQTWTEVQRDVRGEALNTHLENRSGSER